MPGLWPLDVIGVGSLEAKPLQASSLLHACIMQEIRAEQS